MAIREDRSKAIPIGALGTPPTRSKQLQRIVKFYHLSNFYNFRQGTCRAVHLSVKVASRTENLDARITLDNNAQTELEIGRRLTSKPVCWNLIEIPLHRFFLRSRD